jgi:hypothetical protein
MTCLGLPKNELGCVRKKYESVDYCISILDIFGNLNRRIDEFRRLHVGEPEALKERHLQEGGI